MSLIDEVRASRGFEPDVARQIRERARVSQQRMAEELGVTRISISRWENGKRIPRGPAALRYAALLASLEDVA